MVFAMLVSVEKVYKPIHTYFILLIIYYFLTVNWIPLQMREEISTVYSRCHLCLQVNTDQNKHLFSELFPSFTLPSLCLFKEYTRYVIFHLILQMTQHKGNTTESKHASVSLEKFQIAHI